MTRSYFKGERKLTTAVVRKSISDQLAKYKKEKVDFIIIGW